MGPQMGFIAQNSAPFGGPRSAYMSLNGPEHKIWIRLNNIMGPIFMVSFCMAAKLAYMITHTGKKPVACNNATNPAKLLNF